MRPDAPARRPVDRALIATLFDDAALFPPGDAPMPVAVAAHLARAGTGLARLTGPLVCPAARLGELAAELTRAGAREPLGVSVTVPGGPAALPAALDAAAAHAGITVQALELPAPAATPAGVDVTLAAVAGLPAAVDVAVEVGAGPERDAALARLAGSGRRAKLRTGGVTPAAFPPETVLAAAIDACVRRGLPFKLTAGLHHAVRGVDPATGDHHGFLNVLVATGAALDGADPVALLAERDGPRLAARTRDLDATRVRAAFVSYGTCSITEPVDDLVALGLVDREDLA